jgi:hypothetical protein
VRRAPRPTASIPASAGRTCWRGGQLSRTTAILAAERFRRYAGRWPEALTELVPTYLAAVPADPFDLEPLRYRRPDDGVVIYSVGPDSLDSGGEVRAPPGKNLFPADVGVRLWDVAHRRQPPQPADDGATGPSG